MPKNKDRETAEELRKKQSESFKDWLLFIDSF
jgi:hypothetical protein